MRLVLLLACLMLAIAASAVAADELPDPLAGFVGTWEYRQENSAAPSGYDDVGERLEITRRDRALHIVYFGVERTGDHGLYFSVVEAQDVKVDDAGRLDFVVPASRRYHGERPASLEAERRMPGAGSAGKRLEFSGELVGEELRMTCGEEFPGYENCPAPGLVFLRSPWAPPDTTR